MSHKGATATAVETIGAEEVDGIPVAVGQVARNGFFQLCPIDKFGHLTALAEYEPSRNSRVADVERYGRCEPWPTIPRNTLDRR